jgi:anti-sigma factor RsiW
MEMEHEEHDAIYVLMMDALDGELSTDDHVEMESHLRACPPCMREWQAMMAIDSLFRQTPALSPAADFTQRTIARLPNRQARIWAMGTIYISLLTVGMLPLALLLMGIVAVTSGFFTGAAEMVNAGLTFVGIMLRAVGNGAGEIMVQNPAIVGWLFVMIGLVFVWNGVYRQLLQQPTRI